MKRVISLYWPFWRALYLGHIYRRKRRFFDRNTSAKIPCTGRSIAVRRDALWVLIKVCSEETLDMEEIFENVLDSFHI
jgi:hypothetical protein